MGPEDNLHKKDQEATEGADSEFSDHVLDGDFDEPDEWDTQEFSKEELLAELEKFRQKEIEISSIESCYMNLARAEELKSKDFPRLFENVEFAQIVERYGPIKIIRDTNIQHMGVRVPIEGKLEIIVNPKSLSYLSELAREGQFPKHPDLSLFHEVVGHGRHFPNWRIPVDQGGGLKSVAEDALDRVIQMEKSETLRGLLVDIFLSEVQNLDKSDGHKEYQQVCVQLSGLEDFFRAYTGDIPLDAKLLDAVSTDLPLRECLEQANAQMQKYLFKFLTEQAAHWAEVNYFRDRSAGEGPESQFKSTEIEEEGWLSSDSGFEKALTERLFVTLQESSWKYSTVYLESIPAMLRAHFTRLDNLTPGIFQRGDVEAYIEKIQRAFFELPPITDFPEDYAR